MTTKNYFFSSTPWKVSLMAALMVLAFSCKDDDDVDPVPDSCTGVHFEYEGEAGPENWGELCGESQCGGVAQSPVNIAGASADATLAALALSYNDVSTSILNNGHTLQFDCTNGGTFTLNGEEFKLLQFHFHTESEHTVGGSHSPMEVHFVHKNETTGALAVVGMMFVEGAENPVLAPFIDHLPTEEGDANKYVAAATFNPADLLPADRDYFTYDGSLTTLPCSEIVTWFVLENAVEASAAQIQRFEAIMHENHRPVQGLNGRVIGHFSN